MVNRRKFLQKGATGLAGLSLMPLVACQGNNSGETVPEEKGLALSDEPVLPVIISTWVHGVEANAKALDVLLQGGNSLDAAEKGVMVVEADPENLSVGIGGLPDREGIVSLDACVMDHLGRAGSVCFLQGFVHPVAVARKVMEETPHVMLAGEGARKFALEMGFREEELLTEKSRKAWEEWLKTSEYKPIVNIENHDTIGLLAMDAQGNLSGACTTSGLAYKRHGRVGDSPIIGAGLFVDNEVGAATATGLGEAVMRTCGSFLIVELMRQGKTPQQACEEAAKRIAGKMDITDLQVGYLAVDKQGRTGAYSLHPGFNYALTKGNDTSLVDADSLLKA